VDLFGHELKITIQAITDEVAACANMLMGEANEGTPIAVIRGYPHLQDDRGIQVSFRTNDTDLVKQALIEKMERDNTAGQKIARKKKVKSSN
jgi:coenzyme F420-0:L-glutamate ligase/coenzyme F420-1:gamma-L-glutamate ligase